MTDHLKDRPRLRVWPNLRFCLCNTEDECADHFCAMLKVLIKCFKFHVHIHQYLKIAKLVYRRLTGEPSAIIGLRVAMRSEVMRTFTAYIEFDPETKLYVGTVPGLVGAHTQAPTLTKLQENLAEVLQLCLE